MNCICQNHLCNCPFTVCFQSVLWCFLLQNYQCIYYSLLYVRCIFIASMVNLIRLFDNHVLKIESPLKKKRPHLTTTKTNKRPPPTHTHKRKQTPPQIKTKQKRTKKQRPATKKHLVILFS